MRDLVDLYGTRGFGAIAITDHLCETRTFLGIASRYLHCSLTERNFSSYISQVKEEADRAHDLYTATSQAMLDEVNREMANVRARTVANNPRLGRAEVDKIVSQDPEVKRKAAAWFLIHTQTKKQAQDQEEDYENISKQVAKELDSKKGIQ